MKTPARAGVFVLVAQALNANAGGTSNFYSQGNNSLANNQRSASGTITVTGGF